MRHLPVYLLLGFVGACGKVTESPAVDGPPATTVDAAEQAVDGAGPTTCTANTTTCAAGTLTVCDAAGNPTNTSCAFGCGGGNTRCADLDPSNGLASHLDQAQAATPLVLTGEAIIDTSAQTVTNGGGAPVVVQSAVVAATPVPIFVVIASSLTTGNITVRGSRALAFVVDGDVTLNGVVSVSATREIPGPGAVAGTSSLCTARQGTQAANGTAGGGGGGFGSAGGRGGNGGGGIGGMGGTVSGDATLAPLRGGCPGAYAFGTPGASVETAKPGAAGGAVQVSARGRITVSAGAFISASGGGAKGWTGGLMLCATQAGTPPSCNQGSGGGSGGAILLEASAVQIAITGGLVANGGAGHCGFTGFARDGALSDTPVPGTSCATVSGAGNGGAGSGGAASAEPATNGSSNGGGGGGGAGRIRINLPPGATFDAGPPVISPLPAVGAVGTR